MSERGDQQVHEDHSDQRPEEPEQQSLAAESEVVRDPTSRSYLNAVRRSAGWRVSPRLLQAALDALAESEPNPTPERVAGLLSASHGEQSQRQRRHAELWQALGVKLAAQQQDSDPEAQRRLIGAARVAVNRRLSDVFLLTVAIELAVAGERLSPALIGEVAGEVRRAVGRAASPDEVADAVSAWLSGERTRPTSTKPRSGPTGRYAPNRPAGRGRRRG